MGVIPFLETVGNVCNIGIAIGLLLVIPLVMVCIHLEDSKAIREAPDTLLEYKGG